MSTPGQEPAADSATRAARLAEFALGPGTASTSAGASDATLILCVLRCRPARRGRAPGARRGRAPGAAGSGGAGERLGRPPGAAGSGGAGERLGRPPGAAGSGMEWERRGRPPVAAASGCAGARGGRPPGVPGSGGTGERRGRLGLAGYSPLGDVGLRRGSGAKGADSGFRSVTLTYSNARPPMPRVVL